MTMPDIQPTVLVLTALPLEYAAVRAHVEEREERVHRDLLGQHPACEEMGPSHGAK